ncbi:ATP-binding protein [Gottfriedia sp. S16(2024)]|uniref:ATP-binding protein n=1 Tax=Gottfriedia sp. S16(2024) TaxID=3162883 RepID=UPI003D1C5B30
MSNDNYEVMRNNGSSDYLPQVRTNYYPALYNDGKPSEKPRGTKSWSNVWKAKIETIKWNDFFEVERNKMVTYRIIPHSNVTNNTKRLWRTIFKMYEMYEGIGSRLERDGFKLRYREKDTFWYDIIFRQVNGQKKVEFYVSTSEYQAQKLKRKLENKMHVTIKEANVEDLRVPSENTIVQELRYLKHDLFSMNTNSTDTKTPIAGILNTVDELQFDGDFARLSICNEAENRNKWIKNASWAFEKIGKGKVPQRADLNAKKIVNASKIGIAGILNEINDLITDTFQAFTNVFFKSEEKYKKSKVIPKAYSLEDEISSRTLSATTREKANQPVFKSRIRVVSHSNDRLTRETMGETLALAFNEIAENNELHGVKIRIKARQKEVISELNTLTLSNKTKLDGNVNLISTDEMSKLALQMPTQEIQRKYADAMSVKVNVETDIPKALQDTTGIYLGVSEVKDRKVPIYLPYKNPDDFYRGYAFIGAQGMGKDTALQNFVVESNTKHNISFVIPDVIVEEGDRGLADGIRDSLPADKIIDLDLNDETYKIPLDLTEVVTKLGRAGSDRFADEIINLLKLDGHIVAKRILRTAAKASQGSLYNIKRIIENEDYRFRRIAELQDEGNWRLADELLSWGTNLPTKDEKGDTGPSIGNKADPVLNRLDDFFGSDTLFDIFAQSPLPELDFAKWMTEGKVIIVRIPIRKIGEAAAKVLTHWLIIKTWMTRMLMAKQEQENGCFVIFNEPEQFMTEGMADFMSRIATQGRKERLGSLFAFHHWNKLPASLQENLIAGGINQFLFANDHKRTFELASERLAPTFTVEDAMRIPKHTAINIVRVNGSPAHAFLVQMAPPCAKPYDNSFLTKRHARIYGRHWQELQNAL